MSYTQEQLQRFAELLKKSKKIACLTGAGMSTESGIPDYRSSNGLYNTMTSEEVFDIDRFNDEPDAFYKVIGPLYSSIVEAKPNAGHLALHELEEKYHKNISIATQNIDGLHQKAGSKKVYEVHGTMSTLTCQKCGINDTAAVHLDEFKHGKTLQCKCGGIFKPDITFFGEMLPEKAYVSALQAFRECDLAIVLGTSLVVYPAAALPSHRMSNVPLVIINKSETSMDGEATLVFNASIGEVMTETLKLMD